jgi:hypothetical protein
LIEKEFLDILACPKCKQELNYISQKKEYLVCINCKLAYQIKEDIPILMVEEAINLEKIENG